MLLPKTEAELDKCLKSKAWRLNTLYTIVDEAGQRVPFRERPNPQAWRKTRHGLDVILKARQQGFSSEIAIDMLDDCLFTSDLQCGVVAHTKLDAQNIFETKIKLPYENLPPHVRRWNPAVELDKGHLKLKNGSSIRVAVSFRSATTHRLHISEYGKICAQYPSRATEIQTGTLPSVHPLKGGKVVVESTAEGAVGQFWDLCQEAQARTAQADRDGTSLNPLEYRFHFFSWFGDEANCVTPWDDVRVSDELRAYFDELEGGLGIVLDGSQRAWYALTKDGPGGLRQEMKREYPSTPEEAFEASVEGAVYSQELDEARREGRIGSVPWTKEAPVYTFWDLGYGDATVVLYVQFIGQCVNIIEGYVQTGRGATYHAKQVLAKPYLYPPNPERFCYMPQDVMQHEKGSGLILKDIYENAGLRVTPVEFPRVKSAGIAAVREIFNKTHWDSRKCAEVLRALAYYRYEWLEDGACFSKLPVHDFASHPADALQTLALAYRYNVIGGKVLGDARANVVRSVSVARVHPFDRNAPRRRRYVNV